MPGKQENDVTVDDLHHDLATASHSIANLEGLLAGLKDEEHCTTTKIDSVLDAVTKGVQDLDDHYKRKPAQGGQLVALAPSMTVTPDMLNLQEVIVHDLNEAVEVLSTPTTTTTRDFGSREESLKALAIVDEQGLKASLAILDDAEVLLGELQVRGRVSVEAPAVSVKPDVLSEKFISLVSEQLGPALDTINVSETMLEDLRTDGVRRQSEMAALQEELASYKRSNQNLKAKLEATGPISPISPTSPKECMEVVASDKYYNMWYEEVQSRQSVEFEQQEADGTLREELAACKRANQVLESKVSQLEAAIAAEKESGHKCYERWFSEVQEKEALAFELKQCQKEKIALKSELTATKHTLSAMFEEVEDSHETRLDLEDELEQLQGQLVQQSDDMAIIQSELDDSEQKLHSATELLKSYEDGRDPAFRALKASEQLLDELKLEMHAVTQAQASQATTPQAQALKITVTPVSEPEAHMTEPESSLVLRQLEAQVVALEDTVRSSLRALGQAETLVDQLRQEASHQSGLLKSAEEEAESKSAKIIDLLATIECKSAELEAMAKSESTQLVEVKARVDSKLAELTKLEATVESKSAELRAITESKAVEITELQAKIESKSFEVTELQAETTEFRAKVASNSAEITELTAIIESQSAGITDLQATIESKSTEVAKLKAIIESKSDEISELQAKVESSSTEVNELQVVLESKSVEDAELEAIVESKSAELTKLQAIIDSKSSEITELRTRVEDKTATITEIQGRLDDAETSDNLVVIKLEAELALQCQTVTDLRTDLKKVVDQVEELKTEVIESEQLLTEEEQRTAAQSQANLQLQSGLEELKQELAHKVATIGSLSEQISKCEGESQQLNSARAQKDATIEKLQQEIEDLQGELVENEEDQLSTKAGLHKQLCKLEEESRRALEQLQPSKAILNGLLQSSPKISELQQELFACQSSNQELSAALSKLRAAKAAPQVDLVESTKYYDLWYNEVQEKEAKLLELKQLKQELAALQDQHSEQASKADNFCARWKDEAGQKSAVEAKVESLTEKLDVIGGHLPQLEGNLGPVLAAIEASENAMSGLTEGRAALQKELTEEKMTTLRQRARLEKLTDVAQELELSKIALDKNKAETAQLVEELTAQSGLLAEVQLELSRRDQQLAGLELQRKSTNRNLEEEKGEKEELQEKVDGLLSLQTEQEQQLERVAAEKTELESQIAALRQESDCDAEEISRLQGVCNDMKESLEEAMMNLSKQTQATRRQVTLFEDGLEKILGTVEDSESAIAALGSARNVAAHGANALLQRECHKLEEELASLRASEEALRDLVQDQNKEQVHQAGMIAQLEDDLAKQEVIFTEQLQRLQQNASGPSINELKDLIEDLNQQLNEKDEELLILQREQKLTEDTFQTQLVRLQKNLTEKTVRMHALELDLDQQTAEGSKSVKFLEMQNEQLAQVQAEQLMAIQRQLSPALEAVEISQRQIQSLRVQLEEAKSDNYEQQLLQLSNLQKRLSPAIAAASSSEQLLGELRRDAVRKSEIISELMETLDETKLELANATGRPTELPSKFSASDSTTDFQLEHLQKQIEPMVSAVNISEQLLMDLRQEMGAKEKLIKELQENLESKNNAQGIQEAVCFDLKDEINMLNQELVSKGGGSSKEMAEVKRQLTEAGFSNLAELLTEFRQTKENLRCSVSAKEDNLKLLSDLLTKSNEHCDSLQSENFKLRDERKLHGSQLGILRAQVADLQNHNLRKEAENKRHDTTFREQLDRAQRRNQELSARLTDAESEAAAATESLTREGLAHKQTIEEFQETSRASLADCELKDQVLNKVTKECGEAKRALVEMKRVADVHKDEVVRLRAQVLLQDSQLKDHGHRLESASQKLVDAEEQAAVHGHRVSDLEQQVFDLKQQLASSLSRVLFLENQATSANHNLHVNQENFRGQANKIGVQLLEAQQQAQEYQKELSLARQSNVSLQEEKRSLEQNLDQIKSQLTDFTKTMPNFASECKQGSLFLSDRERDMIAEDVLALMNMAKVLEQKNRKYKRKYLNLKRVSSIGLQELKQQLEKERQQLHALQALRGHSGF